MSTTDPSFDAIRSAISALWPRDALTDVQIEAAAGMLLLQVPSDVAAFAVFNGNPGEEFRKDLWQFQAALPREQPLLGRANAFVCRLPVVGRPGG